MHVNKHVHSLIIIIIIISSSSSIIIIIIIIISFMQGIYTYIPETNCVPREYNVAAILLLVFTVLISLVPLLNLLYIYIGTSQNMCAVPNIAVFWSSLASYFPGILLAYFLNVFEIVPVTIHGAYIISSSVESIVLLNKYFPNYVCSAQYGCFLEFLAFIFSRYVAHVFSECL